MMAASLRCAAPTSFPSRACSRKYSSDVHAAIQSANSANLLPPFHKPYLAIRRLLPVAAAQNEPGYGSDEMSEEEMNRAYDEAAALFSAAHTISNLQIQQELEQSVPRDAYNSSDPVLTHEQTTSFFLEQGLSSSEANKLYLELKAQEREYTLHQLSACVARWNRVLPGASVAAMVLKDSTVLDADVGLGLMNIIRLVEAFPGRDVVSMIQKQPRLLWCEEIVPRIERSRGQLIRIHPSNDCDVVTDIILEYPELLYRMDYYKEATLLDELPIEIQNMMVVADQGIGYIFRYYKNRETNYAAEVDPRSRSHFFGTEA